MAKPKRPHRTQPGACIQYLIEAIDYSGGGERTKYYYADNRKGANDTAKATSGSVIKIFKMSYKLVKTVNRES
jgi:hypothetical protein